MAKDIVCEKEVNEATAFTTNYSDQPFYFCSEKCERAFVGNPIRYVNPSGAVASTEGSPKVTESGRNVKSSV